MPLSATTLGGAMDDTKKGYIMKQAFDQNELHEREALCTQQEPPNCQTICPIHVNVREICDEVKKGNFDEARKIFEKSTLFPNCIVYGCDGPCESGCVREGMDQGVQIRKLEKAVMQFGTAKERFRYLPKKKKEIVYIVGESVASVALAGELGKKGYTVKLYIPQKDSFGDIFTMLDQEHASKWMKDFDFFLTIPVEFHWQEPFDIKQLDPDSEDIQLVLEKEWMIHAECEKESSQIHLFEPGGSFIDQLSQGRSMALTIDWAIQKVSTSIGREKEGSYQTTLYTNLDHIEILEPVKPLSGDFAIDEAIKEANRCIHCECLECVKACGFLQYYHKYPKVAIREIYNNLSIVMGNHLANGFINSCSLCGQCKVICPNGFDLGEVCLLARNVMTDTDKMPVSTFDFALKDLAFSNGEAFFVRHQPGYERSRFIFFPGCQTVAIATTTVEEVYQDLMKRVDGGVGLMTGCCGIIAQWAGDEKLFREQLDFLEKQWVQMGKPMLIVGCSNCMEIFQKYSDIPVRGIWDLLEEIGLPEVSGSQIERGTIFQLHDACGARNHPEIQESIRRLVSQKGCTILEEQWNEDQSGCCGYGGLTNYANPDLGKKMSQMITTQSDFRVLTYCMNCRDQFVAQGKESYHILELFYKMNPQQTVDISMKRFNRLLFKEEMLEKYWNEGIDRQKHSMEIQITDDCRKEMNQRMILESDVRDTMSTLDQNGSVWDEKTDEYWTCKRMGEVTFWVKSRKDAAGLVIEGAYTHRMEVEGEA